MFVREKKAVSNKLWYQEFQACKLIKREALAQVFSCEFCEISKNTFFHRTPLVVASANLPKGGNL